MSSFNPELFLAKLGTEQELDREAFLEEVCLKANRHELASFLESLKRSCTALQTERISFISDKCPEVTEAIFTISQADGLLKQLQKKFEELESQNEYKR